MRVKVLKIREYGEEDVVFLFNSNSDSIAEKIKDFISDLHDEIPQTESIQELRAFCENEEIAFFDVFESDVRN